MGKKRARKPPRPPRKKVTKPVAPASPPTKKASILVRTWRAVGPVWATILAVLTLAGAYWGYKQAEPRIEITLRDTQFWGPMPSFTISNEGLIAARETTWDCAGRSKIYLGPSLVRNPELIPIEPIKGRLQFAPIGTLDGGSDTVRNCRSPILEPGANLTVGTVVIPVVHYRHALWPFEHRVTAVYVLVGEEDTPWHWEYRGEAIELSQAQELRNQGYELTGD
jgi:hypothetical protein